MWGEMSEESRDEYKQFFLAYHDRVARLPSIPAIDSPLQVWVHWPEDEAPLRAPHLPPHGVRGGPAGQGPRQELPPPTDMAAASQNGKPHPDFTCI